GATVRAVARTSTIIGSFARTANTSQRFWPVSAFDRSINKVQPPRLLTRAARYPSDRAAYRAVLRNADLIIVPSNFLFSSNQRVGAAKDDPIVAPEIGQSYTMVDPATGAARDVTVAAVTYADVTGSGAFYGQHGATALFGPRLVKTSAFISTRSHSAALVRRLEHVGVANGVQADVISDASDKFFKYINDVVNLYRSDLGIGIVVGIAGIAVVLVRSVRDRRRQIGTLRAMGFDAGEIGWSFVVEGAFVAIQGLVVGVGLGFALIMALTQGAVIKQILGYNPGVSTPSLTTVLMAIGLFVVSILASAGPARSASRIPPAVALRLVD
ncbi:MAG: putative transport system permease protein, partial [Actinomycetota bacterium]